MARPKLKDGEHRRKLTVAFRDEERHAIDSGAAKATPRGVPRARFIREAALVCAALVEHGDEAADMLALKGIKWPSWAAHLRQVAPEDPPI